MFVCVSLSIESGDLPDLLARHVQFVEGRKSMLCVCAWKTCWVADQSCKSGNGHSSRKNMLEYVVKLSQSQAYLSRAPCGATMSLMKTGLMQSLPAILSKITHDKWCLVGGKCVRLTGSFVAMPFTLARNFRLYHEGENRDMMVFAITTTFRSIHPLYLYTILIWCRCVCIYIYI